MQTINIDHNNIKLTLAKVGFQDGANYTLIPINLEGRNYNLKKMDVMVYLDVNGTSAS